MIYLYIGEEKLYKWTTNEVSKPNLGAPDQHLSSRRSATTAMPNAPASHPVTLLIEAETFAATSERLPA